MSNSELNAIALAGLPLVVQGDDLAEMIMAGAIRAAQPLADGDIVVIAQKIVSKAHGYFANLADMEPSPRALELAEITQKDPRQVELILRQANDVVAYREGVLVVEQLSGIVMANAGIDASNVAADNDGEKVLLLPDDPDGLCQSLRDEFRHRAGAEVAVVINDSVGRAWRTGTMGLALGAAGLPALLDLRGDHDLFGRELMVSQQAIADEIASLASLLQGQGAEGRPVVIIRGLRYDAEDNPAATLLRPKDEDMFR